MSGFKAAHPVSDLFKRVMEQSEASMSEQVRQGKIFVPALSAGVRRVCPDFLQGGEYGAPSAALRKRLGHIKPHNDEQEEAFAYVDNRMHKNPNETTETSSAKQKAVKNKPHELLDRMSPEKRDQVFSTAYRMVPERDHLAKRRREEISEAKVERMQQRKAQSERKTAKTKKKKEEFKAVELARTVEDLKSLLCGLNEQLAAQTLRAQIRQYTNVHGVSTRDLPLSKDGKKLRFNELYTNLSNLLERGDPLTAPKVRSERKRKRGRPKMSKKTLAARARDRKMDEADDDVEMDSNE